MLSQKDVFKGMSYDPKLISFQRMCRLLGLIRKMKALQRSARGRFCRVADTLTDMRAKNSSEEVPKYLFYVMQKVSIIKTLDHLTYHSFTLMY